MGFSLIGQMLRNSLEIVAFTIHVLKSWNMENYYYDLKALPKPDPPEVSLYLYLVIRPRISV